MTDIKSVITVYIISMKGLIKKGGKGGGTYHSRPAPVMA